MSAEEEFKKIATLKSVREKILQKITPWLKSLATSPEASAAASIDGSAESTYENFLIYIIWYMRITRQLEAYEGNKGNDEKTAKLSALFSQLVGGREKEIEKTEAFQQGASYVTKELMEEINATEEYYYTTPSDIEKPSEALQRAKEGGGTSPWIIGRWVIIMKMFLRILGWDDVQIIEFLGENILEKKDAAGKNVETIFMQALKNRSCNRILIPISTGGVLRSEGVRGEVWFHASLIYCFRTDGRMPWSVCLIDSSGGYDTWYLDDYFATKHPAGSRLKPPDLIDFYRYLTQTLVTRKASGNRQLGRTEFAGKIAKFLGQVLMANAPLVKDLEMPARDAVPTFFFLTPRLESGMSYQGATPTSALKTGTCGIYLCYFLYYYSLISHMSIQETISSVATVPPNIDVNVFARFIERVILIFHGEAISGLGKIKKSRGGAFTGDATKGNYLHVFEKMQQIFINWTKSNLKE